MHERDIGICTHEGVHMLTCVEELYNTKAYDNETWNCSSSTHELSIA
jgi:hypothetical protein